MKTQGESIQQLIDQLEDLLKRQEQFSREVIDIRKEIENLKSSVVEATVEETEIDTASSVETGFEALQQKARLDYQEWQQQNNQQQTQKFAAQKDSPQKNIRGDLEKFIGENLSNKIGIAITVIGVAIGAKYAIDHQLISPLNRIILGYLVGIVLLGFAIKLKKNYDNFSAVLLSGSMAILYFITYAAYSFYALFPQIAAFIFMVIITAFTVYAAINYNRQVIAHIGLVGAYALPFLLSEGEGRVDILFSYIAIINIGILVISFKKYWKPLYYSAFALTWVIYGMWYGAHAQAAGYSRLAMTFLSIFFVTFYLSFLSYKLPKKEKFDIDDIILLLANTFIFYGIGYGILANHPVGMHYLGLFTLANAAIHCIVAIIVYPQKLADRNLFYLVTGLTLLFITMAIPVQFDGNWVTLLWAGEAALLFWIGRTKNVPFYEILSYALMILAFISIIHDWVTEYYMYHPERTDVRITPVLNINFMTSLIFVCAFAFINVLFHHKQYPISGKIHRELAGLVSAVIPGIFLIALYYTFRMEISIYWKQLFVDSTLKITHAESHLPDNFGNYDLYRFKTMWLINYSALFLSVLAFVNIKRIKNQSLGLFNLGFNAFVVIVFLIQGLYVLGELRDNYLDQNLAEYYHRGVFNIVIRYISFAFIALLLLASHQYIRQEFIRLKFGIAFDALLHLSVLWVASSELINWMDIAGVTGSNKLGLSIFWGFYSFLLIALGIWRKKKHLRIGAIALFTITLLKLFFFDISSLDTIAKTIVFVSLGVLLLIISFLYNKYRLIISDDTANGGN